MGISATEMRNENSFRKKNNFLGKKIIFIFEIIVFGLLFYFPLCLVEAVSSLSHWFMPVLFSPIFTVMWFIFSHERDLSQP